MQQEFESNFSSLLKGLDKIPKSKTRQDIIDSYNNNEDDHIQTDRIKVSLLCPLSKKKIEIPVRC